MQLLKITMLNKKLDHCAFTNKICNYCHRILLDINVKWIRTVLIGLALSDTEKLVLYLTQTASECLKSLLSSSVYVHA